MISLVFILLEVHWVDQISVYMCFTIFGGKLTIIFQMYIFSYSSLFPGLQVHTYVNLFDRAVEVAEGVFFFSFFTVFSIQIISTDLSPGLMPPCSVISWDWVIFSSFFMFICWLILNISMNIETLHCDLFLWRIFCFIFLCFSGHLARLHSNWKHSFSTRILNLNSALLSFAGLSWVCPTRIWFSDRTDIGTEFKKDLETCQLKISPFCESPCHFPAVVLAPNCRLTSKSGNSTGFWSEF